MDHQDVDERGQPYDLILPESSLKGNSPGPGEYVWDTTHLERTTPGQVVLILQAF